MHMCVLNDTVVWHCSSKSVHYRTLQSSHKKESSKKNCSCSKGDCDSWGVCSFPEPLLALGSWAGPPALESEGPDALVPDWSWGSGSFLCSCCYKSLFKGWRAWSLMSLNNSTRKDLPAEEARSWWAPKCTPLPCPPSPAYRWYHPVQGSLFPVH